MPHRASSLSHDDAQWLIHRHTTICKVLLLFSFFLMHLTKLDVDCAVLGLSFHFSALPFCFVKINAKF